MNQNNYNFHEIMAMVEQGDLITLSDIAEMYPELTHEIIEKAVRQGDIDQPIKRNLDEYYWTKQISLFYSNFKKAAQL